VWAAAVGAAASAGALDEAGGEVAAGVEAHDLAGDLGEDLRDLAEDVGELAEQGRDAADRVGQLTSQSANFIAQLDRFRLGGFERGDAFLELVNRQLEGEPIADAGHG